MKKEKYTNLITLQLTVNDYIEEICCQDDELRVLHFISKAQVSFLCNLKKKLSENECIILLDFAENYSYIVQDGVQEFHWNNSQATLHPFVIYFKNDDGIHSLSYCVMSDILSQYRYCSCFYLSHVV